MTIPGIGAEGDVAATWVARSKIRRWPGNPRFNAESVPRVVDSMRAYGFGAPILARSSGELIAGDTRLQAADVLGLAVVPVRFMDHLSDAEAEQLAIADNRLGWFSSWDEAKLKPMLLGLDEAALGLIGFSAEDVAGLGVPDGPPGNDDGPRVDPSAALLAKWGVERGQLWEIPGAAGRPHRLLCGDSTLAADVGRLMSGATAVMLETDAPYGIDYSKTKDGIPDSGYADHQERWGDMGGDTPVDGPALQAFLERAIRAALPFMSETAAYYFWHPMLTQGTFFAAAAAAAADILIHRQIIWVKPGLVLTRSGMYHWKHELCFYGWRRGHRPPWYGDKSQTSVWEIGRDDDSGQHQTQKPVELFVRPLLNHTRRGELVYEPFAGSGSQLLAAEQNGRVCYAMEVEPRHVAVSLERLSLMGCVPKLASA